MPELFDVFHKSFIAARSHQATDGSRRHIHCKSNEMKARSLKVNGSDHALRLTVLSYIIINITITSEVILIKRNYLTEATRTAPSGRRVRSVLSESRLDKEKFSYGGYPYRFIKKACEISVVSTQTEKRKIDLPMQSMSFHQELKACEVRFERQLQERKEIVFFSRKYSSYSSLKARAFHQARPGH